MPETNRFAELAAIDVGKHIEKKGKFSYLSWAWAVDQLLRRDPAAVWTYAEPARFGSTMLVSCTVTAFGIARTMHLPVMNPQNKAIDNPDAFAVNTAMQRCLVKAIALHGLGLYIYAGEDLPPEGDDPMPELDPVLVAQFEGAESIEALATLWESVPKAKRPDYAATKDAAKARLSRPALAEQS